MTDIRSFRDYVTTRFENEIWDALDRYITERPAALDVRSYLVNSPEEAELCDITYKRVDVFDTQDDSVLFDVIIEAEITISGKSRRDRESDDVSQWFRVSCRADLENGKLDGFVINSISVYDRRQQSRTDTLSDTLVPVIAKENFDDVAELFLKKYYPEALLAPTPINVREVIRRMGLNIKETRISRYFSLFGEMVFSDCKADVFNTLSRKAVPLEVRRGTILIDPDVFFMRNIGSWNNTVIHECVHWFKHRKYHWLAGLYRSDTGYISCKVDERYARDRKKWSDWDWMEWHANGIAPRILMPKNQTIAKIEELIIKNSRLCSTQCRQAIGDICERSNEKDIQKVKKHLTNGKRRQ
ncbi:hypothetical protein FACS189490_05870 [Clostridia bacterium]|nr:hypothetical protein FACS189490_05870 [Clostridia bacterium]